jgi:probable F420-dependent oxidoreductase
VNLLELSDDTDWPALSRRAENLGFDVVAVPDHLGMPAPFPALTAVAAATRHARLGPFVLNTGFYNPVLLAREVATLDQLSGGRLELGLGTGYVHAEFAAAGIDPGTPKDRVDHLERTLAELVRILGDETSAPRPAQKPLPPMLLGGTGNRMLRLAAAYADIAGFTGAAYDPSAPTGLRLLSADAVAERVAYFADAAAERADAIERNVLIQMVVFTPDRDAAIRAQAHLVPYLAAEELLELPVLLVGTQRQIIDQLRAQRDRYGFSYVTVLQPYMEAFAPVVEALRGT